MYLSSGDMLLFLCFVMLKYSLLDQLSFAVTYLSVFTVYKSISVALSFVSLFFLSSNTHSTVVHRVMPSISIQN